MSRSSFEPSRSASPSRPRRRIDVTALVIGVFFLAVAVLSWTGQLGQLGRLVVVGRDGFWWVLIALGVLLLVSVVRGRRER